MKLTVKKINQTILHIISLNFTMYCNSFDVNMLCKGSCYNPVNFGLLIFITFGWRT